MRSTLAYLGRSEVAALTDGLSLSLKPNLARDQVFFDAQVQDPLRWREAMSALHEVVIGDLKFRKRSGGEAYQRFLAERRAEETRVAQAARQAARAEVQAEDPGPAPRGLKKKFETARRRYWRMRDEWGFELRKNDPELFRMLVPWDPIVTVAPDVVLFEGFSRDESSYGCLSVDREAFAPGAAEGLGTTNVDYSVALYEQIQTLRTYRPTRLKVDPTGFEVQVEGRDDHREEKIDLPPAWLRGFGQLQAATTLPATTVRLDVPTVYAVLAFLRRHREKQGPRAIRFELVPGQAPRLVIEPWGHTLVVDGAAYAGPKRQSVQVWGRRRLLVLARLLPLAEHVDVRLLGSGLPSLWTVHMGQMRFVLGLSGWTANDWTSGASLELLSGAFDPPPGLVAKVEDHLRTVRSAAIDQVPFATGGTQDEVRAALFELARLGQVIYDFGRDVARYRPVLPVPLGADVVGPEPVELTEARRLFRAGAFRVASREQVAGLDITVADVGDTEGVELGLDADGIIRKGRCSCSYYYRNRLRQGPCRHLLALRLHLSKEGAA